MAESDLARVAFDDMLIDFTGRRLFRGGVEQALEPKAFAVLAFLAATPGRVFTRDEILDAVWGHRHVTPGVLNRIVTLVRQALGEDARGARLLQTMYGVGYRFEVPPRVRSEVEAESSDPSTVAVPAQRAWRGASWSMLGLAALLVLGAALMQGRADSGAQLHATPTTAAAASLPTLTTSSAAMPTLVVMPLKPIGDDAGSKVIAEGLGEELVVSLVRVDGLRVIARASTLMVAAETTDPVQLMQRLGVTHVLEGSLQQAGENLRVRMRLVGAASGTTLWIRDFDRFAADILDVQQEIAESVATSLALKMGWPAAPVERSDDAVFLHRYFKARTLVARADLPMEESNDFAESEFRKLLQVRPDDARLHAGLALALQMRAMRQPSVASLLREETLHEAKIAQRLDPALPEPYFINGYFACAENDWERCLPLMQTVLETAPSTTAEVVYGKVFSLAHLGYVDRAEETLRGLRMLDPLLGDPHLMLGRLLDTRGLHEEARAELARSGVRGRGPRWFNAVWRGDLAGALDLAEHELGAARQPPTAHGPGYAAASRALANPSLWSEAYAAFDQYERNGEEWHLARVFTPDAHTRARGLIAQLDGMRKRGYSSWPLLLWSRDLAWLRRDPSFQDYLRDSGILAYWRAHGFPAQCRAAGDGAACD